MRTVLVTGGCGFIGSHLVEMLLRSGTADRVVNLDCLTYAGNVENLAAVQDDRRYVMVRGDISDDRVVDDVMSMYGPELVINCAAESHVDRSILDSAPFMRTNAGGVATLVMASRKHGVKRFLQMSTDEVYGTLGEAGKFTHETPLRPSNPYSASKAAGDLVALSYHHTYGMDVVVTRCSNNYGARQFHEKLIPIVIARALRDEPIPMHGSGRNVRDWIHVEDHCRGVMMAATAGVAGQVYNFGGDTERTNLEVVETILDVLGKPKSLVEFVEDRPGNDLRYAMDTSRVRRDLGWAAQRNFEKDIEGTVNWYAQRWSVRTPRPCVRDAL